MSRIRDIWLRHVLRPLGRLVGTDRWEPHIVYRGRCLACGDEGVFVILAATPCRDIETGHVFGTQCGECGEWAVTSI